MPVTAPSGTSSSDALNLAGIEISVSSILPVAFVSPFSVFKASGFSKVHELTSVSEVDPSENTAVTVLSKSSVSVLTGTVCFFGNQATKSSTFTIKRAGCFVPSTLPVTSLTPWDLVRSSGVFQVTDLSSVLPSL